jgi:tetraacyldisaccharide 4'-kinase
MRVALVGHAYRARPGRARVVRPDDDVADVGDDALYAARCLRGTNVDVVVGPNRQSAAMFAARRVRCLVFDGLLQARPARLARSILLLDGARAWQSAHCPPAGDLRAPLGALLHAADRAVMVQQEEHAGPDAWSRLERAIGADGSTVLLSELRGAGIGLVSAIARPDRLVQSLARRGIHPVATMAFPDHHRPTDAELAAATARTTLRIDAWLTTGKCATKLPATLAGAPILVLDHAVGLSERLVSWVASAGPEPPAHFPAAPVDALFPSAGAVG